MQRCPRPDCRRAGDDVGNCGETTMGCPRFVTVDPLRDVVIQCEPCGMTRAISTADLMNNRTRLPFNCKGSTDNCQAVVINGALAKVLKGKK